jgi:glycosyltransferase involved in cell wall biosynthesis
MIAKADKIVAFNRWDEELTSLVCGSSSKTISIPPSSHESRLGKEGFRSKKGIEAEYILWAGGWLPAKGPRNLSERFILFRNRHPDMNVKLVMFGGYGNSEFPTPHPDIVVIDKNSDDLPSAIKDCLFVAFNSPPHPVGYDANPLILLEALMHGKTFIAQAGTPFLTEIKNLGIVVNSDSEWIEAAETLVLDSEKRHALEHACYRAYLEKYNFGRMMAGIESVLNELLDQRRTVVADVPRFRRERREATN